MPLVAHRPLESLQRIQKEGQEVLDIRRAHSQDIRELHIGLLNMMPDGALQATERQFLRLIGNSNRIAQFYVHIFTIEGVPRSPEMQVYIDENYEKFSDLAEQGLDALIVTGTNPVHQHLSDEPYVDEIRKIFRWADDNVTSVVCSCLASHAAFEIFYGIKRQPLAQKLFGVFEHRVLDKKHPLLSNINTRFDMPHSRRNDVSAAQMQAHGLKVLVAGKESGVALATSPDGFRQIYLQGHPEYDVQSLLKEYQRDAVLYQAGKLSYQPALPAHYFNEHAQTLIDAYLRGDSDFPVEALTEEIDITWRDTAKGIFANWLGLIYELTHYDRRLQFMDGIDPNDPLAGKRHD